MSPYLYSVRTKHATVSVFICTYVCMQTWLRTLVGCRYSISSEKSVTEQALFFFTADISYIPCLFVIEITIYTCPSLFPTYLCLLYMILGWLLHFSLKNVMNWLDNNKLTTVFVVFSSCKNLKFLNEGLVFNCLPIFVLIDVDNLVVFFSLVSVFAFWYPIHFFLSPLSKNGSQNALWSHILIVVRNYLSQPICSC